MLVSNNRGLHLLGELLTESESQMKNRRYQRPVEEQDLRVNDTSYKINPARTNTKQVIMVLINKVLFFKVLFFVVNVKWI